MSKTIIVKSINDVCKDMEKKFVKAGRNTVNIIAAVSKKNATNLIYKNFTVRNNFTQKNLHFEQCGKSVTTLSEIKSEFGILKPAGYMERQEEGGVRRSSSGNSLVIPNTNARKGKNTSLVHKDYRYSSIKKKFYKRTSGTKMALAVAAFNAAKNKGFIRIDNTIFQVTNFEPKRDNRMFVAKPILNMNYETTTTPKKEWLKPATDYAARMMQDVFNQQMDKLN